MTRLPPGSTIGILGGGQLGRMTAMAARSLGYHIRVLDPDPSCAARFVVEECITASFDDAIAAAWLAHRSDVITLEIESVSLASLDAASANAPVRPSREVMEIIQDRIKQKTWLADRGFPVGPFRVAHAEEEIRQAAAELGTCFVKAAKGGYDGRSQMEISGPAQAAEAFASLGRDGVVVEKALPIEKELSLLVVRSPSGEVVTYAPAENHHEHRILVWSVIPARVDEKLARRAAEMGREVVEKTRVEGLLVVEFFLSGGELLINELAPRPHNSYHATEVGCRTSQFEQHARAVCDLPLGSPDILRPAAIMNLLGDLWESGAPRFDRALRLPGIRLHLYGKRGARPGRKMGHLSATGESPEDAIRLLEDAYRALQDPGR